MARRARWVISLFGVGCAACGSSSSDAAPAPKTQPLALEQKQPEEASAAAASSSTANSPSEDPPMDVPTTCSKSDGACTPERKWVERLCRATYPSVALALFSKGSPWTRGYLTRKTETWNAAGGASEPVLVDFDEEVIVLLERAANSSGIQVSGASGGYEALRWDGGCITLSKEELTLKRPPQPLAAKVE